LVFGLLVMLAAPSGGRAFSPLGTAAAQAAVGATPPPGTVQSFDATNVGTPYTLGVHYAPAPALLNGGPAGAGKMLRLAYGDVVNHKNRGRGPPVPPFASAEVIDLNAAKPAWRPVAPMSVGRRQLNATLLPDGQVLVTGGTSLPGRDDSVGKLCE
jgi:hypothetical protein